MKKLCLLAALLLVVSTAAFADTVFYTQPWDQGDTSLCNTNTPTCGSTGWTVYDNFDVPGNINKLTDFTYVSHVSIGAEADYKSTNWFLFGPNAANPFGTPVASGTATGTLTDLGGSYFQISVTGLNVALTPGTPHWIIGFQNNVSNNADVTSAGSSTTGDLTFWQQSNDKAFQFVRTGDNMAFSVSGTPEPSTLLMLGTGLIGGLGALRRKLM